MKKRIDQHIRKQDFVKVYITDEQDLLITHFEGIIFKQSDKYLLMNDMTDFNFDGFVILKKSDISEIKHKENEIFFKHILDNEKITESIIERYNKLDLELISYKSICNQLYELKIPIIIECKYNKSNIFQIGPIREVADKKIRLQHFNATGEFDLKTVSSKFKEITFIKIDSPYANIFYKYAKEVE